MKEIHFKDFTQCSMEQEPDENNGSTLKAESDEKPITDVLDFAMREIVKQDSLTDELICPMLSDLELTIWVCSYFNNKFFLAEVR